MTPYDTDEIPAVTDLRQRVSEADPDARMTGRVLSRHLHGDRNCQRL